LYFTTFSLPLYDRSEIVVDWSREAIIVVDWSGKQFTATNPDRSTLKTVFNKYQK